MAKNAEQFPDLREFIKENDQRLYDFCFYMMNGGLDVDEMVLSAFRDFGDEYRKLSHRHGATWEPIEIRIRLFRVAWERILVNLEHPQFTWTVGRDTRTLKNFDEDLLSHWQSKDNSSGRFQEAVLERLARIDADFRAPVVLRDILKFDDEEVVRILGIRWGVYRHRLHRGRLEFKDGLRGRPVRLELTKSASA